METMVILAQVGKVVIAIIFIIGIALLATSILNIILYSKWRIFAVCPRCSSKFLAPAGNRESIRRKHCNICGLHRESWDMKQMRWRWYKWEEAA